MEIPFGAFKCYIYINENPLKEGDYGVLFEFECLTCKRIINLHTYDGNECIRLKKMIVDDRIVPESIKCEQCSENIKYQ